MAVEAGAKLSLGTDAHSPEGMGLIGFAIATAGRGWVTKDDVINTMPLKKLVQWVRSKRP